MLFFTNSSKCNDVLLRLWVCWISWDIWVSHARLLTTPTYAPLQALQKYCWG